MRRRRLGITDLSLSEVALGTWALSGEAAGTAPVDPEAFGATVAAAREAGVTTYDVSPLWAGGEAERALGRALDEARDGGTDVEVIDRGGIRRAADGTPILAHDPTSLIADCEASLERLGRERIDLWLLQGLPEDRKDEGFREAIETLQRDGKIRCWGVSAGDPATAQRALASGAEAICVPLNLIANDALRELESDLVVYKAGVLARSPLAYGLLALRWDDAHEFPRGDHRRERWPGGALAARLRQAHALRFLGRDVAESPAEAALRWVLGHDEVAAALVGARTPAQLTEAARASVAPPTLPDEDLDRLDEVMGALGLR